MNDHLNSQTSLVSLFSFGYQLSSEMEICVKTIFGRNITLEIESWTTISDLKEKILVKEGIIPDEQRFIYGGEQLVDGVVLDLINVIQSSRQRQVDYSSLTLHLVLRLRGGGNAVFHRPLRIQRSPSWLDHSSDSESDELPQNGETKKSLAFELSGGRMQIHIMDVKGCQVPVEIEISDTVGDIKQKIFNKQQFDPNDQKLVFGECYLNEGGVLDLINAILASWECKLSDSGESGPTTRRWWYYIDDLTGTAHATILMIIRLQGGENTIYHAAQNTHSSSFGSDSTCLDEQHLGDEMAEKRPKFTLSEDKLRKAMKNRIEKKKGGEGETSTPNVPSRPLATSPLRAEARPPSDVSKHKGKAVVVDVEVDSSVGKRPKVSQPLPEKASYESRLITIEFGDYGVSGPSADLVPYKEEPFIHGLDDCLRKFTHASLVLMHARLKVDDFLDELKELEKSWKDNNADLEQKLMKALDKVELLDTEKIALEEHNKNLDFKVCSLKKSVREENHRAIASFKESAEMKELLDDRYEMGQVDQRLDLEEFYEGKLDLSEYFGPKFSLALPTTTIADEVIEVALADLEASLERDREAVLCLNVGRSESI